MNQTLHDPRTFSSIQTRNRTAYSAAAGLDPCLPTHPDSLLSDLGSPEVPRLLARCSRVPRSQETVHSQRTAVAPGLDFGTKGAADVSCGSTTAPVLLLLLGCRRTGLWCESPLPLVSGSDRRTSPGQGGFMRVGCVRKEEEDRGTYSARVYADDARAKIGSACVGSAWLVCADGRRQERSTLELVVLSL